MTHTIGEVARMAGVTIRTLHHYDDIGLVSPAARSESGYRQYGRADLERLQEVLVLRQLDLPLETIGELLDSGAGARAAVLRLQRDSLLERRDRLDRVIATVEASLKDLRGDTMTDKDLFDGFDPAEHEEEARDRWGHSDEYRESARRTASYRPEDWQAIKDEVEAIESGMAALLADGVGASDPAALTLAEEHRLHIDRWFYACPRQMHVALADSYVSDPRFRAHYDDRLDGLAEFVRDAVRANAERTGDWGMRTED